MGVTPPPSRVRDTGYMTQETLDALALDVREWEADMALLAVDEAYARSLGIVERAHPHETRWQYDTGHLRSSLKPGGCLVSSRSIV